ncbi:hypothetical protein HZU75_04290 [Chitinibacter fontanus]|uniref:Uncharacterized protein n=1 Tax=Chitinibacter fontanus TaxID=1737446 RepID=A0A7D5ZHX1_9NEIS|nr:hypothetical protein [Chitinibacter fontanus]QLI80810.1 hypothetical protein HZU75_04290 [Chitinibacter fontanus]
MKAWFLRWWGGGPWLPPVVPPKPLGGVDLRVMPVLRAWVIHQSDVDWVTLDRGTGEAFMRLGRATPLFEPVDGECGR